ncbi:PLP-dependent aminotransferase family protein [Paenibacillus ehimensis]|uniref:PLP-dependent aminotransferase family protein n=1 Tax=Paenibacillus ehimensis TaxID=79264 RepID=A0ABT8VCQ1_9BACL|nr:PLP-dependent aminotransferase family protein [Paenibacillus ehimensis]MDO3678768.1 PLP-dependent aminotransferase family protein [Paenibacillus ehimensis]
MWKPDRLGHVPMYRQIADYFERRIVLGELPPGSILPPERKLAGQWQLNRSTIIQAYEELRSRGLIDRRKGSGTRVSLQKWEESPKPAVDWQAYAEQSPPPGSPLLRKVREEARKGAEVVDLAGSELSEDLIPMEAFRQLMREQPLTEPLGYTDPQGFYPLREALAVYLRTYRQVDATASSIFVTSGIQQALYLIARCLLRPGDAVGIEVPSYHYSSHVLPSAGLRTVALPADEAGIRPDELAAAIRKDKLRMLILNPAFQNPTGRTLRPDRRKRLLEIAADMGIPIVEDDPYGLAAFRDEPPVPLKAMDTRGVVLYVGSLSKMAAPGLRTGWLVGPDTVIRQLSSARQQMDMGPSVLPEWLSARFLASDFFHRHLLRVRRALKLKSELLMKELDAHLQGEMTFERPDGGLYLWGKLAGGVSAARLLDEGIKRGVLFVPGSVFGPDSGHVRLTFARPSKKDIAVGAARFAEAFRAASKR